MFWTASHTEADKMSQRIKLKFYPFPDMVADIVCELAGHGFNIQMEPCAETDHYVMIAELAHEGEEPELLSKPPTLH
jgi:hypothetical protein